MSIFFDSIKNQIDECSTISFDIFDTLLLRPFIKPEDLFCYIEEINNTEGFAKARIEAQKKAQLLNFAKKKIDAVSIDDIYKILDAKFQHLKQIEIEKEIDFSIINQEMYEIYLYAKERHKKIFLTSDMHLPKDIIQKMLIKNNVDKYDEIFISSEIGLTKASGKLYDFVCKKTNIEPKTILHIGDTEISDYKNAVRNGFCAILYKKKIDTFFSNDYNKRFIPFIMSVTIRSAIKRLALRQSAILPVYLQCAVR